MRLESGDGDECPKAVKAEMGLAGYVFLDHF
jgi:hypothetical protein